jgi:hypothetical protein
MLHNQLRFEITGIYYNRDMKRFIILCSIVLLGCSSKKTDWDSGAAKQNSYQVQKQEETTKEVRNQFPSVAPSTDTVVP